MTTEPSDLQAHEHQVTEANPIEENLPDHGGRVETPVFSRAKAFMHALMKDGVLEMAWGEAAKPGDIQMHHSGSIPIFFKSASKWRVYLNTHGSEYSGQFIIDPAKLDKVRQAAADLVAAFPDTLDEMDRRGYKDGRKILMTPIVDAQTISNYVDSVWNSQSPIPAKYHTGVLHPAKNPDGAGEHHYPKPLTDMQHLKWDDFVLWHLDPESGTHVAVSATAPRGSGVASVKVEYAAEGTSLHEQHMAARAKGEALVLPPDNPIAQAAFAKQGA